MSSFACSIPSTPAASSSATATGSITTPPADDVVFAQMEEVKALAIEAAIQTATHECVNNEGFQSVMSIFRYCNTLNEAAENKLRTLLAQNPELATWRATNLGALASDGQTPLHCAASYNNLKALQILVSYPNVSVFDRDTMGRTALHIASERGHIDAINFLRREMASRGSDPVGIHAPIDLAGATPLGRASMRKRPSVAVETALFSPGDRSILPRTPYSKRAGKSPWKPSAPKIISQQQAGMENENIVYGSAEAKGWSKGMEDRMTCCSPLPLHPAWSLFAVFDGHGGAFCAEYASQHLVEVFETAAKELAPNQLTGARRRTASGQNYPEPPVHDVAHSSDSGSPIPSVSEYSESESDSDEPSAAVLEAILYRTCTSIEDMLKAHPRLQVSRGPKGQLAPLNSSGTTGVLALVTRRRVAIANIGDSRAIFGRPAGTGVGPSVDFSTTDHKLCLPAEYARAVASGAVVQPVTVSDDLTDDAAPADTETQHPVEGQLYEVHVPDCVAQKLRMSRAFGDFALKHNDNFPAELQAVVAVPDVTVIDRHRHIKQQQLLVLACDGIWDVMTNDEVMQWVAREAGFPYQAQEHEQEQVGIISTSELTTVTPADMARACDSLLEQCLARRAHDNLTVIAVVLAPVNDTAMVSTGDDEIDEASGRLTAMSIIAADDSSRYASPAPAADVGRQLQWEGKEGASSPTVANADVKVNKQLSFEP